MSSTYTSSQPGGWFTRLVKIVIRIFFACLIGLILGAGIYFGVNALFTNIIHSIQVNSARIEGMEASLKLAEAQQVERNSTIISRLQALEVSNDQQKTDFSELQGRIDALEADQADLLETAASEVGTILDEAAKDQADMLADLDNLNADLKSLRSEMHTLGQNYDALQAEIEALNEAATSGEERLLQVETEWADQMSAIDTMVHKLQLFKAIELLTRSRYHLVQNNLGLASQDIQSGYALLVQMGPDIPEYQADMFAEILTRMESALANLPQKPVAAADDVDSAWNLLLLGLPEASLDETSADSTPTPTSDNSPTPTPKP